MRLPLVVSEQMVGFQGVGSGRSRCRLGATVKGQAGPQPDWPGPTKGSRGAALRRTDSVPISAWPCGALAAQQTAYRPRKRGRPDLDERSSFENPSGPAIIPA